MIIKYFRYPRVACITKYIFIYLTRLYITLKELSIVLFLSKDLFMRIIIEHFSHICLSIYLTITTVVSIKKKTMPYAIYDIKLLWKAIPYALLLRANRKKKREREYYITSRLMLTTGRIR